MGQNQSGTANWSTDDWAFGTGPNAISTEEVITETSKLPAKLFGGAAIERDPSMHQMQRDLLAVDETLKRIFFRRKKSRRAQRAIPQDDAYYYQPEEYEEPVDAQAENKGYLAPSSVAEREAAETLEPETTASPPETDAEPGPDGERIAKLFWRCTNCMADNKVTESSCRRCGMTETAL